MMEKHRIQTEVGVIECRSRIYLRQGVSSVARRTLSKKDKIILLLKQGETTSTIIANKVECEVYYVGVVRKEFLRSQKT
jgi:hypothetical protein